jgi:hypothetical protein
MNAAYMDHLADLIGFKSYNDYLLSDHWKSFCASVRSDCCWCCNRKGGQIQVHHVNYANLGKESEEDVITVCGGCHKAIHALCKNGTSLSDAHFVRRKQFRRNPKAAKAEWVSWFKLLNKSKRQTLAQLKLFLVNKGLSDDNGATEKAFKLGFVQIQDGKERWNRHAYIGMMMAHAKVEKLRRQGKPIHSAQLARALCS